MILFSEAAALQLLMWNLLPANKLTQDKFRRKSYEKHRKNLKEMKPIMKIHSPAQPEFVYSKPKREMSRIDRLLEIDHQNQILLYKMTSFKDIKQNYYLKPESQQLKTLNQHIVELEAQDICNENRRVCRKLMEVNSHYPTFNIMEKTDELEKVRVNISINARRCNSAKTFRRPLSSALTRSPSQFYRSHAVKGDTGSYGDDNIQRMYKMDVDNEGRPESAPVSKKPVRSNSSHQFVRKQGNTQPLSDQNIQIAPIVSNDSN